MPPESLPSDVAAFIDNHPLSVDEVEALTAMTDARDRWWDAKLMAGEIGVSVSAARGALDRLASLNLLDIRVTDEVRYRFQPGTSELGQTIPRLVAAYRSNPKAVIRAAIGHARRSAKDFADAFRFRKDDRDR